MFRREYAPEHLPAFATAVEGLGFDELWVVEDLGYHGGFAQAATALALTSRIDVGLGIAPAVARNAGYAAMEVATLSRMHPGRFHMGFGHGEPTWIEAVGATPVSWIASLEETTSAVTALVAGGRADVDGRHVRIAGLKLVHPATPPPAVSLGVRGPKGIELVRRCADGVILVEGTTPERVAEVRAVLGSGPRITLFKWAGGAVGDESTIDGPIDTWRAQIDVFAEAGATSVVLVPLPDTEHTIINDWRLP